MSLTSYLNGKHPREIEFQNIIKGIQPSKKEFLTLSTNKPFSEDIKAPYILTESYQSTIVGVTFDYLARFMVAQKIIKDKHEAIKGLIAKHGLFFIEHNVDKKTINQLRVKYDDAIAYIEKFITSNQEPSEELICHSYLLGKLEQIARCRMMPEKMSNITDYPASEIVEDLYNLCNVFKEEFILKVIKENSVVIFNPHFGSCSRMVGGADADIYVDGVLYDFKCTKNTGYKGKDIQQIIGYYLFNRINIELKDNESQFFVDGEIVKINAIAIYSARSGQINYIDTATLDENLVSNCIEKLLEMFEIYLKHLTINPASLLGIDGEKTQINKTKKKPQPKLKPPTKIKKIFSTDVVDRIVYTTEKGKTYHNSKECISLQVCKNIQEVNLYDIRNYKNQCTICKNK